jgi:hypothetical protein
VEGPVCRVGFWGRTRWRKGAGSWAGLERRGPTSGDTRGAPLSSLSPGRSSPDQTSTASCRYRSHTQGHALICSGRNKRERRYLILWIRAVLLCCLFCSTGIGELLLISLQSGEEASWRNCCSPEVVKW